MDVNITCKLSSRENLSNSINRGHISLERKGNYKDKEGWYIK